MKQPLSLSAWLCVSLWLVLGVASITFAQDNKSPITPAVTAAASSEQARFLADREVVNLRLEVFTLNEARLYDSDFKAGNLLDWNWQDAQGQRLADGTYRCVVTAKDLSGHLSQRQGVLLVQNGETSWQSPEQAEASLRTTTAAVKVIAYFATVTNPAELSAAVLAHDGKDARLMTGSGALSFRSGNFLQGNDLEQMRLTADGQLEVKGAIRTGEGIVFPDGTVQKTAYVASGQTIKQIAEDGKPGKLSPNAPAVGGSGTPNVLMKWAANGVDAVNSSVTDLGPGGGITVNGGVQSTFYEASASGTFLSFKPAIVGSAFLLRSNSLSGNIWIGHLGNVGLQGSEPASRFATGGGATIGAALYNIAAPTNGLLVEGNTGIGTTAPAAKLDVLGDIRSSALRQELTLVNFVPVPGPPNVINGFMGTGSGGATPGNRVTAGVVGASIGGGGFNGFITFPSMPPSTGDRSNRVTDWFGTVGGGYGNLAGSNDATLANSSFATVGGGSANTASGSNATVGGGGSNTASGSYATVGGGSGNTVSGTYATVSGGMNNSASGAFYATIGGGFLNEVSGQRATVGGGYSNRAISDIATVSGGQSNIAFASATVSGGQDNNAFAFAATVSGGQSNTAGSFATAAGGYGNQADGSYSFAAGRRAKAYNLGTYVWGDSTDADFASTADNQFLIRAAGGVGIGTNAPDQALSVNGNASKSVGGTTWAVFSDERLKHIRGKYTPGLRALLKLQPIRFEYKADNALGLKASGETVGFSAQAVAAVLPEAVTQSESGYLQLNSDPILWTMLNSIKEQQAQIQQLLQANQQLRQRLNQVERRTKTQRR